MRTKYIFYSILMMPFGLASFVSCSLDKDPLSDYSEVIYGSSTDSSTVYTYDEMYSQYQALYQLLKDRQEHWYLDYLLLTDAHSDNAYGGTTGSEVIPFENNSVDASSSILYRDWTNYLSDVAQANIVINYIDNVTDTELTDTERTQWKAEAKIFRSMIWFDMVRIWGNIPLVTDVGVDITSDNIKEVWDTYYPSQSAPAEVYAQIIDDLTDAVQNAPDVDASDKTILSKSVAKALLAKVYAEEPVRDYGKVLEYCNSVIDDGFTLVSDFSDLFGMNETGTDTKLRSTSESILEIDYPASDGNWVTWMFGRDLLDYDYYFTWAKWVTPSRNLISAYEVEGDTVRYNQSVVYYECTWSNYYASEHYPFMYKCRSSASSIIKIRLADILLLKAEALVNIGTDLQSAASIVNTIRERAGLSDLSPSVTSSQDKMLDAVLHERRLELAFEGQRWFDLIRYGKMESVMNALNEKDSGRLALQRTFDENCELLPIPQASIDVNTNLVQNPGY